MVWFILICFKPAMASVTEHSSVRGFGTIALTHAGNRELGFRNDIGQDGQFGGWELKTDSVLGIQVDTPLFSSLSFSAQLIAKDRITHDVPSYVERAHFTYSLNPNWTFRLGRISNDTSLISEFGSVGYAYDWVRSPVEYYGSIPVYYFDGGDVTYSTFFSQGMLSTRLFVGQASDLQLSVSEDSSYDLSPYIAASVRFDNNNMTMRAGYAQSQVANFANADYTQLTDTLTQLAEYYHYDASDLIGALELEGRDFHYYTLGFEYRDGDWKYDSELSYLETETEVVLPFVSGYASIFRRFGDWGIYGIGSFIKTTKTPRQVDENLIMSDSLQGIFGYTDSEQQTISFGTRWDICRGVALKAQWDHSRVAAHKAFLWEQHTRNDDNVSQSLDNYTLLVSFIF